jgi:hypothetical protein
MGVKKTRESTLKPKCLDKGELLVLLVRTRKAGASNVTVLRSIFMMLLAITSLGSSDEQ